MCTLLLALLLLPAPLLAQDTGLTPLGVRLRITQPGSGAATIGILTRLERDSIYLREQHRHALAWAWDSWRALHPSS